MRHHQKTRAPEWFAAAGLALTGMAIYVNSEARRAERLRPPEGRFVVVNGIRLHYLEQGRGRPVVMLHGNGAMAQDLVISGLFAETARKYRAIAFDRPGFGYSDRPEDRTWDAEAQAALLADAFARLGLERPIVLGHSWGAIVAMALALNHPEAVSGLVVVSGYYFPSARADVVLLSPPATPVLGHILSHTLSPLIGRALAPLVLRQLFSPQPVTAKFKERFALGLALRPSQVRAFSADTALMVPSAAAIASRYGSLRLPVMIVAGDADPIVNVDEQARRLHRELKNRKLDVVRGMGHMLHHFDAARVMQSVNAVANT